MRQGAHTPEELETLFEDACIVGDAEGLLPLFEQGAVLVAGGDREARGREEIARAARAMWGRDRSYIADPRRVLQARDTALSVGSSINVLRRGSDGAWRYAIALMDLDQLTTKKEQR
ncbi:MAG: hypothetical protein H0V93_02435 [Euzebyales bacterium]|nr:hypothetical protein [Euzebyales bacterium]